MADPTNNSFIPKRNPIQKERIRGRKVYIGTLVVQIIFIASLVGAVGVYAYERKLDSNLEAEVSSLNNAISTFDEAEMDRVLGFDTRLKQLNYRFDHAASVVRLLEAIEASTVGSVRIEKITLDRTSDTVFEIESSIVANSFDSALFQRNIMESGDTLVVKEISDLSLQNVPPSGIVFDDAAEQVKVSFRALLGINIEKIKPVVTGQTAPAPVIIEPTILDASTPNVIDEVLSEEPQATNPEIL